MNQPIQRVEGQGQHVSGQSRSHQAFLLGFRTGPQQIKQGGGLGRVKHGILVGEIHAAHLTLRERLPHRTGLAAVSYQNGDIRRAKGAKIAVQGLESGPCRLRFRQVQQKNDFSGSGFGHPADIAVITGFIYRRLLLNPPERHGRRRLAINPEPILTALCSDFHIRNAILKQKRTVRMPGADPEHLVDRQDKPFRGAKIFSQRIRRSIGISARRQIGVDIRTAKGVNRLFGIADH